VLIYGPWLHYFLHGGLFPIALLYRLFRMIWRMAFRYHGTGTYFITMKFKDIREANRYIKKEEAREQSEFLDYKILERYGLQN